MKNTLLVTLLTLVSTVVYAMVARSMENNRDFH